MSETVSFIKSGFCPEETKMIDRLIAEGFGKSRADLMRKAMLEFISAHRRIENEPTIY